MKTEVFLRGHPIEYDKEDCVWKYCDTQENVWGSDRQCKRCNKHKKMVNGVKVDACMDYIENASAACCGHGTPSAYILFPDGTHILGNEAKKYFKQLKEK